MKECLHFGTCRTIGTNYLRHKSHCGSQPPKRASQVLRAALVTTEVRQPSGLGTLVAEKVARLSIPIAFVRRTSGTDSHSNELVVHTLPEDSRSDVIGAALLKGS